MNRRELEEYLRGLGCELLRHGKKHDVWWNPATEAQATIPRHRTLRKPTAKAICRELGVPPPDGL
ncbi:MAG: type II toxin-antitoxin system HicA family toxin [Gemmataceae bacterium]|nr:type II toxin-antitoxin system HicA family toxin [Gemmataceae bacterium]